MAHMYDPPPPARFIKDDVLPELGLSMGEAAEQLGVSRAALSRVLSGKAAISPEMAMRFEAWLKTPSGGGPKAESLLRAQAYYDLWQIEHRNPKLELNVRAAIPGREYREMRAAA